MNRFINNIFIVIVVLLPWHSFIINGFFNPYTPPIVLWKECSILILFVISLLSKSKKDYKNLFNHFIIIFTVFLLSLFFFFNSIGINAIFNYRAYVLPLILAYSLNVLDKRINWDRIVKVFIYTAFTMSLFSLIQQFFIGDWIYLKAGYPTSIYNDQHLSSAFYNGLDLLQRGTGGFTSPIPYSFYLAISIILTDKYSVLFKRKNEVKCIKIVLALSLFFTFTRSTIIGLILFYTLPNLKVSFTSLVKYITLLVLCIIIQFVLVSQQIKDLEILTITTFWNTLSSFQDSSSEGHFNSLNKGSALALKNIVAGEGLGTVGSQTANYNDKPLIIESSYLSMIVEIGLFASICFLYSLLLTLKIKSRKTFSLLLLYGSVAFLLPIHYYVDLSILYLISVAALNHEIVLKRSDLVLEQKEP